MTISEWAEAQVGTRMVAFGKSRQHNSILVTNWFRAGRGRGVWFVLANGDKTFKYPPRVAVDERQEVRG